MSWALAGISAEAAWTTFAAFGAVVTALYFLRLRRRPIEVPFVHLWREVLERQGGRLALFARFPDDPSAN